MNRTIRKLLTAQFAAAAFMFSGLALAQTPPLPPPPEHPALEPAALEILKATSDQLAKAGAMSFTALATFQYPARNGQPLYYTNKYEVVMRRPDKLRVIMPGDGPASDFFYDGKVMAAYAPAFDLVAYADAPPTIDATLKLAEEKAAIFFPFEDVLVSDPYKALAGGLKSAFYIGQSKYVGGVVTDMVAVANDDVQAQLWIGVDDGLPRMARVSYPKDPMRASYDVTFSDWKLNGLVEHAEFSTPHIQTSPRMEFSRPDAAVPGSKQ
jgi:hypothetical protein